MLLVVNRRETRAGAGGSRRPRTDRSEHGRFLPAALPERAAAMLVHDTVVAWLAVVSVFYLQSGQGPFYAAHRQGLALAVAAFAALALTAFPLVGARLTCRRLPGPGGRRPPAAAGRLDLRTIAPEDLLGRPQVAPDRAASDRLISGRRVLVTGAGGTIGGELCRQIAALRPAELVLLDHGEFNLYRIELELRERTPGAAVEALIGDVRDAGRVERIFAEHRPELVFHAAALKHVPLVEANPVEGVLTNVLGARVVADAARAHGALAVVQVSTDKAVNPTSVMGATKRIAESYCQALDLASGPPESGRDGGGTRFVTVRFGNVIGSSGSVVPLFQRQLARGGPLTVTHPEARRYFMTTREAAELVLQAAAHGLARPHERGRIFVLDTGEPVRIVDVARQMIRLAGLEPDVDVGIAFIGLRPGEKLHEELFYAEEVPVPTEAKGVLAATPRPVELPRLAAALDELVAAARRDDARAVRRLVAGLAEGSGRDVAGAVGGADDSPRPDLAARPPRPPTPIDLAAVPLARPPEIALGAAG
ncbi:MAG TPA: polysaccharide biosynthesis protein [Geminicoccaceae bacterium]|nr:polysaccharide biosynthesis protein [Geminicoccaceae bacterium]